MGSAPTRDMRRGEVVKGRWDGWVIERGRGWKAGRRKSGRVEIGLVVWRRRELVFEAIVGGLWRILMSGSLGLKDMEKFPNSEAAHVTSHFAL